MTSFRFSMSVLGNGYDQLSFDSAQVNLIFQLVFRVAMVTYFANMMGSVFGRSYPL